MSYKAKSNVSDDVSKMLRVDHAGEYGAVAIYRGQQAVFRHNPKTASTASKLSEMEQEEQKHLDAFDKLLIEKNVRPTALMPLWNFAGLWFRGPHCNDK